MIIPALLSLLPISVKVNSENDKKISVKVKLLFFTVFSNKKPKKKKPQKNSSENQRSDEKSGENKERIKRIKHLFGIDRFDSFKKLCRNVKEGGIDGTFSKTLNIIKFIFGQLKLVTKHLKIKKLIISFISGGDDASSAAFGYGLACSAVYPITGYIRAVSKSGDNISLDLKCDFDADKPVFLVNFAFKIRIFYLLKAALLSAVNIYRSNKE